MRIILAHTLGGNFESFCEVNQKLQRLLLFFLIPRHTKENQAAGQNRARIGAYRVVQTLYWHHERWKYFNILMSLLGLLTLACLFLIESIVWNGKQNIVDNNITDILGYCMGSWYMILMYRHVKCQADFITHWQLIVWLWLCDVSYWGRFKWDLVMVISSPFMRVSCYYTFFPLKFRLYN